MAPTVRLCCFRSSFLLKEQPGSGHATTALKWHELCRTFWEAPWLYTERGHKERLLRGEQAVSGYLGSEGGKKEKEII